MTPPGSTKKSRWDNMAKNDNTHALRFYNSLAQLDGEAASRFAQEHPLSKSANYEKKFRWAKEQCRFLEENFSPEDIEAVRARCHCEAGAALARRMRGYWEAADSLEAFAASFNEKEKYVSLEAVPGGLVLVYPECYCACVKRVEEPISKTWCLCTLGHVKGLFYQVLDREVEAELVETIKTGGARCAVKLKIERS